MASTNEFHFKFSLSTLNHLGRGLYRSFATVIAEAISNAWDADAELVNIKIVDDSLFIFDNGNGMNRRDIQEKFLKIGYTRRSFSSKSDLKERYILGRKGIGKLAYLSISDEIIVYTKRKNEDAIAFKIDNKKLDDAIDKEKEEQEYTLEEIKPNEIDNNIIDSGTHLIFKGLRNNLIRKNIRQVLATQFHFAHALNKDDKFEILVNDTPIGIKDLKELYEKVQYVWFFNEESKEEFKATMKKTEGMKIDFQKAKIFNRKFVFEGNQKEVKGYIASVLKPKDLLIAGSRKEYKANVALFSGGRMREAELIAKITRAQIPENYLFGQIHIDAMDSEDVDRFTSGRDSVIENDPLYLEFLEYMRGVLGEIIKDWDKWRRKSGDDGDPENTSIPIMERKIDELFMRIMRENIKDKKQIKNKLVEMIRDQAHSNLSSYVRCFIAENLMRGYIKDKGIGDEELQVSINKYKKRERNAKTEANIEFEVSEESFGAKSKDLNYLDFEVMAAEIDKHTKKAGLADSLEQDIKQQKPIRNALMHTAKLSETAKKSSDASWENIKVKIINFINE